MQRVCECGRVIPPQMGSGRPRRFCETCRPKEGRGRRQKGSVTPIRPGQDAPVTLLEATRRDLTAAGREGTPKGLLAIELAAQIAAGGHPGTALAALSRAYSAALESALAGASAETDAVDSIFGTA